MSLKAKINNFSRERGLSAQVVLQNFMFECFLQRLSESRHRDKIILKGGILIAALVGINNRSTMDIDATIKNYPLNDEAVVELIREICDIMMNDDVIFTFSGIETIRGQDEYGGYRVSIIAKYDTIIIPLKIDITSGDVITPKEILYSYKMIFEERFIKVWAYNIETVLAEKVETILQRGELNTRARDFYDIFILTKTQDIDGSVVRSALSSTTKHRKTLHILDNVSDRVDAISKSESLKKRWLQYTKDYRYADGIIFSDVIDALRKLVDAVSI